MNVLYLGTPEFAVAPLHAVVNSSHHVVGVVTVPDKPAGRGLKHKMSAVKSAALNLGIPVLQPDDLSDSEFFQKCKELNPDIVVVVAFRKLPEVFWKLPKHGTFNLHASLLPQYRGAAPINWAIINGEKETGITTFFINDGIDTGTIIHRQKILINQDDTAGTLHDHLSREGASLVVKTLDDIESGQVLAVSQQEIMKQEQLTGLRAAPRIFKHHCKIDWTLSAYEIRNHIRGLAPYPGAYSEMHHVSGKSMFLKIFEVQTDTSGLSLMSGQVMISESSILVGTGDLVPLKINVVQPQSKKPMRADAFLHGLHEKNGWFFHKNE
jgi:methionyl-tRNA formyltransferase